MIRIACVALVFTVAVFAASLLGQAPAPVPAPAPASDFALTIYSTADPATFDPQTAAQNIQQGNGPDLTQLPGFGVVREIRKIDLVAGENILKFTGVAVGIDPTTVAFKSLTAPDSTSVFEQNYEFDLMNPDKLLGKYLGKEIIINRKQKPLPDEKTRQPETIQGTLLSYDGSTFVLQTDNKRLPVQLVPRSPDISEIKLFDLDTGLITKPTLVWKIQAQKAGQHDAQVTYQTDGLTWRADYSIVVNKDDTAADLSAWVSILNMSGIPYPDAKLKLVAGDVHRLERQPMNNPPDLSLTATATGGAAPEHFVEKTFFEYHLYTLSRPTSLANNSTKQIELFAPRLSIPLQKVFVYYGEIADYPWSDQPRTDRELGIKSNTKVDIYLQIDNTEKNNLGIPLPAGRVRVYKKDEADAASEFIGEDVIKHIPKDEQIRTRVGTAFDIVGERKQTDFQIDLLGRQVTESFEITLRNHKKEAIRVLVRENLYRWSNWQITAKSDAFEKIDSRTIHFPVDVPADAQKKVTYTVKYTW